MKSLWQKVRETAREIAMSEDHPSLEMLEKGSQAARNLHDIDFTSSFESERQTNSPYYQKLMREVRLMLEGKSYNFLQNTKF